LERRNFFEKKIRKQETFNRKKFCSGKILQKKFCDKKKTRELRLPAAAGPPRHLPAARAAAPRLPAASREADPAAAAPERGSSGAWRRIRRHARRWSADPAAHGGGELGSGGIAARDGPFLPDPAGAELARRRGRRRHGSAGGMARRRGQRGRGSAGGMAWRRRRKGEREERKGKG